MAVAFVFRIISHPKNIHLIYMRIRILVIDDEESYCEILKYNLEREGYEVDTAESAEDALRMDLACYQLMIVDIMMERLSGFDFAKRVRNNRATENTPIIFCSALNGEDDTVMGLNIGADDYITKPFAPVEVLARVKSQLRRYSSLGSRAEDSSVITLGGISLDDRSKTVTVEGEPVNLTPTEYAILKLLMSNPGKVFSTKVLYESVWQEVALGSEGAVAVHIRHLREKIEIDPSEPRYLKVMWGQGYKMERGNTP